LIAGQAQGCLSSSIYDDKTPGKLDQLLLTRAEAFGRCSWRPGGLADEDRDQNFASASESD
jgi:hypothetical protein